MLNACVQIEEINSIKSVQPGGLIHSLRQSIFRAVEKPVIYPPNRSVVHTEFTINTITLSHRTPQENADLSAVSTPPTTTTTFYKKQGAAI